MRTHSLFRLLLGIGLAAGVGCSHRAPRVTPYRAVVERVEEARGLPVQYYTPEAGAVPVTRVRLRLVPPPPGAEPSRLEVLAAGLRAPGELGRPGDTVRFGYPGRLPPAGVVRLEALRGYRVVR